MRASTVAFASGNANFRPFSEPSVEQLGAAGDRGTGGPMMGRCGSGNALTPILPASYRPRPLHTDKNDAVGCQLRRRKCQGELAGVRRPAHLHLHGGHCATPPRVDGQVG